MSSIARFCVATFVAVSLTSVAPGLLAVTPPAQQIITTVAGGGPADNLAALEIGLGSPQGVAIDADGNLFVAASGLHRVLRLDAGHGTWTTVAGNGAPGFKGDGGPATSASLWSPAGVAVDGAGNLFIADSGNFRIRRVDSAGTITTVAGGSFGSIGDGGPATSARLFSPQGVVVDVIGNLFIADATNHRIRRVDSAGTITTVAGNGTAGFGGDGGAAASARLWNPIGLAADGAGNVFIADRNNNRIRRVDPAGTITTVAGNGTFGFSGDDGPATTASLANPHGLAVDSVGNLFIADLINHRVRRVELSGRITTVAGDGIFGLTFGFSGDGGPATSASVGAPTGVAVDSAGNLFIAASGAHRIRRVDPAGTIITVAGNGTFGFTGDGGPAVSASLASPEDVAVDGAGNLFIADRENQRIRRVDQTGTIMTFAGNGSFASSGDGGAATSASLRNPVSVAVDRAGNLFIAESNGFRIRRVDPAGTITRVAGNGTPGFSGDGGPATSASLSRPRGLAVDGSGNLFIVDDQRIRRVDSAGTITTVAGNGTLGFSGDGGPATSASLSPLDVAVDGAGNLFIADGNQRIRRVDQTGTITTFAGNGTFGFSGDGGAATSASLRNPDSVAVDGAGNLYIADSHNSRIRRVDPAGTITTVAGNGTQGFSGDGGPATSASLRTGGVAVDGAGNLFIADFSNHRIRRVSAANTAPTVLAAALLERQQGSAAGGAVTIATVSDAETAAADLSVTLGTLPGGLTIGPVVNVDGTFTAPVQAGCGAAVGTNTVGLQASDGSLTATSNLTVNVTANTPPTLGTYAMTVVSVGGEATVTPTQTPADNGSVNAISAAASAGFSGTLTPDVATGGVAIANAAPVGTYTVTIAATDNCGTTTATSFTLKVADTTPPEIVSVTPSTSALWAPNRQMVPVTIAVNVSDNVDPNPSCSVIAVMSSDPITGRGDNTSPDWVIGGGLSVTLRAERAGTGSGRIYTLTVECKDASGNAATAPVIVGVAHDRGAGDGPPR